MGARVLTERPDDLIPELQLADGRHVVFLDALHRSFPRRPDYRRGNRSDELFGIWEESRPCKSFGTWTGINIGDRTAFIPSLALVGTAKWRTPDN